jgi:hypothetical protein
VVKINTLVKGISFVSPAIVILPERKITRPLTLG